MDSSHTINILKKIDDFDFNVLDLSLDDLFNLSWIFLEKFNFFANYNVPLQIWREFIWKTERKYNKRNNSFHNFHHALSGYNSKFILYVLIFIK
jgi:cAMP-specific phosphodiesterase 4